MKSVFIATSALAWAVGTLFLVDSRRAQADGLYLSLGIGNTPAAAGPLDSRNTTINATSVGQTFKVQVFADVYGNGPDGNADGLDIAQFSLLNFAQGTTGTTIGPLNRAAPFNASPIQTGAAFTVVTNGVANVNRGAVNGTLAQNQAHATSYVYSRSGGLGLLEVNNVVIAQNAFFGSSAPLLATPISNSNGTGSEFYLGSATITIGHLGSDTSFNAVPRMAADGSPDMVGGLWFEDVQFTLDANGSPYLISPDSNPTLSPFGAASPISIIDVVGDFTWNGTTNNVWDTTTPLNWTNASAAKAYSNYFDRANPSTAIFNLATPAAITVNDNIDVGNILFTTGGWTLNPGTGVLAYGGTGYIVITTTTGSDTINAPIVDGAAFGTGGGITSLIKLGDGTLTLAAPNTYTGSTTINAGTLVIAAAGALPSGSPVANYATFAVNANANAGAITGSGNTLVQSNATLTAASIAQAGLTINGTVILASSPLAPGPGNRNPHATTSVIPALTIAGGAIPTATLNLNNNTLIIPNGGPAALAAVEAQIAYARHGGAWDRHGITSSTAQTAHAANGFDSLTLGDILNSSLATPYTTFGGLSVSPSDVLIKLTYGGDANLNGVVNGDDYFKIDQGFVNHLTGWINGDFNHDGVVSGSDYSIIDSNFVNQSGQLAASEILAHEALFGPSYLSGFTPAQLAAIGVPEPMSLTLLGLGAMALLARRRASLAGE